MKMVGYLHKIHNNGKITEEILNLWYPGFI